MIRRHQDDVRTRDAEKRAQERERAGCGRSQRAADPCGRPGRGQGAEVPTLSLRINPTVIARIASASRAPAAVAIAIGVASEVRLRCVSTQGRLGWRARGSPRSARS